MLRSSGHQASTLPPAKGMSAISSRNIVGRCRETSCNRRNNNSHLAIICAARLLVVHLCGPLQLGNSARRRLSPVAPTAQLCAATNMANIGAPCSDGRSWRRERVAPGRRHAAELKAHDARVSFRSHDHRVGPIVLLHSIEVYPPYWSSRTYFGGM